MSADLPPSPAARPRTATSGSSRKPPRRRLAALFPAGPEWRQLGVGALLGLLSALLHRLTLPPVGWWPLAFVCLLPWLWSLRGCRPALAFWIGFVFGVADSVGAFWFLNKTVRFNGMAMVGLPIMHVFFGLHVGVVGSIAVALGRRLHPAAALVLTALAWGAMEWWKGSGQLAVPIGFLSHGLVDAPWIAGAASLGGVPLVSAVVVAMNLALMTVLAALRARGGFGIAALNGAVAAAIAIVAISWSVASTRTSDAETRTLRIAFVQPNVEQMLKLRSYADPDAATRQQLQETMTLGVLRQIDAIEREDADLIVTPETVFTTSYFDFDAALHRELNGRARDLRTPILVGAMDTVIYTKDGQPTDSIEAGVDPATGFPWRRDDLNGLWLFDGREPDHRPAADYHKVVLVPFGESAPYVSKIPGFVEFVVGMGLLTAGEAPHALAIPLRAEFGQEAQTLSIGPSICFEDLIPWIHRVYARAGVQLFVNVTNDAWYDPSYGAAMHALCARWRCLENRTPMIRVTNTGLSMWIDERGEVRTLLPAGTALERIVEVTVPSVAPTPTLYARLGDTFGIASFVLVLGALLASRRRGDEDR